jgi:hypothetical protein
MSRTGFYFEIRKTFHPSFINVVYNYIFREVVMLSNKLKALLFPNYNFANTKNVKRVPTGTFRPPCPEYVITIMTFSLYNFLFAD